MVPRGRGLFFGMPPPPRATPSQPTSPALSGGETQFNKIVLILLNRPFKFFHGLSLLIRRHT